MRRPSKDTIKRFLFQEYKNNGIKYLEYMFGASVSRFFYMSSEIEDAFEALSTALIGNFLNSLSFNYSNF